jgi:prepilin-type N-terminal cleavage/methylation domain-containing protein
LSGVAEGEDGSSEIGIHSVSPDLISISDLLTFTPMYFLDIYSFMEIFLYVVLIIVSIIWVVMGGNYDVTKRNVKNARIGRDRGIQSYCENFCFGGSGLERVVLAFFRAEIRGFVRLVRPQAPFSAPAGLSHCKIKIMNSKSKSGFSLVELMTTMCIIGILTATGLPAYREYVTNSKYAQSYTDLDAFSKAQQVYFSEFKRFVTITPPAYALIRKNGKQRILYPENEMSWKLLGTPIKDENNFGYMSIAGFTDETNRHFLTRGIDAEIEDNVQLFRHQNVDNRTINLFLTEDNDPCTMYFNYSGLGVGQQIRQDWTIMIAGANFRKEEPEICSIALRIMKFQNGEFVREPVLHINRGE